MNEIKSFPFFKNYYKLYKLLKTPKDKEILMNAIFDYMFFDKEPKNLTGDVEAIWDNIFMPLEKSKNKVLAGMKGGKTNNQNNKQTKVNEDNQTNKHSFDKESNQSDKQNSKQTDNQSNKQNNNQKGNEILISNFFISNFLFLNDYNKKLIKNKILDWIKYKQENHKIYKEQGLKSLLTQIENITKEYGVDQVINLIDECMANGYQGIIFDKLKSKPKKGYQDIYEEV